MRLFDSVRLPLAAQWQENTVPFDWTLTERAREQRPSVRWWWGPRDINGTRYALCYLCNATIAATSWGTSITAAARTAILTHRDLHLTGAVPTPGGHTVSVPTE